MSKSMHAPIKVPIPPPRPAKNRRQIMMIMLFASPTPISLRAKIARLMSIEYFRLILSLVIAPTKKPMASPRMYRAYGRSAINGVTWKS